VILTPISSFLVSFDGTNSKGETDFLPSDFLFEEDN
jgi:hypothetical protein